MKSVPSIRDHSATCWLASAAALLLISLSARGEVPNAIAHQGRIVVQGVNFEGDGQFKFLLFADADADHASGNETPVWSNASTIPANMDEPASAVTVAVTKGLYGTWLGDTTIANMAALPASVEPPTGTRLYLRVWFSDSVAPFIALAPDQAIAAVPFALSAASVTQGGVTADALADGAVTSQKLAAGAVTGAVLEDGAITSAKLAGGAVTGDKIATGAVTGIGIPGQQGSITHEAKFTLLGSSQFGLGSKGGDLALQNEFAYVVDILEHRLQIFDVSDPGNVVPRGSSTSGLDTATGIAVKPGFAYVVGSGNNRLQIFQVSDPDDIVPRGFIQTGLTAPVDVAVSGDRAYVIDHDSDSDSGSLNIFNVSDPDIIDPQGVSQAGLSDPTALQIVGSRAYVIDRGTASLQIFSVANPQAIVPLDSDQTGLSNPVAIEVSGGMAYVVDRGTRSLQIFDVSNSNAIVARGSIRTGIATPVGLAVSGSFAYVTDIGNNKIHVFNVGDPDHITPLISEHVGLGRPVKIVNQGDFSYVVESPGKLVVSKRTQGLSITGELTIKGGLIDDIRFSTPRSYTLTNLSEATGQPIPVQLPQGAEIDGVDVLYSQNWSDPNDRTFTIGAHFKRLPITPANPGLEDVLIFDLVNPVEPVTARSDEMVISPSGTPIDGREVIDNANFGYFLTITKSVSSSPAVLVHGFRIRYTLSTLAP